MGLCKCPKKKVTNLFCFEHRVNVCESCLVDNHSQCIVQSYLQWLQDSDYDPTCKICQKNLTEESFPQECIRLICYDVFHWECLNRYAKSLPSNTAPAGYQCPTCSMEIFPSHNLMSPVADALRESLKRSNWARPGLGLTLIEESPSGNEQKYVEENGMLSATKAAHPVTSTPTGNNLHSVITVDEATAYSREKNVTRKLFETTEWEQPPVVMENDHDDDKYKRRPALQWLFHWFNSRGGKNTKRLVDPNASWKKFAIMFILISLVLFTVIGLMIRIGRNSEGESDPLLDPMANPNIRVGR